MNRETNDEIHAGQLMNEHNGIAVCHPPHVTQPQKPTQTCWIAPFSRQLKFNWSDSYSPPYVFVQLLKRSLIKRSKAN